MKVMHQYGWIWSDWTTADVGFHLWGDTGWVYVETRQLHIAQACSGNDEDDLYLAVPVTRKWQGRPDRWM